MVGTKYPRIQRMKSHTVSNTLTHNKHNSRRYKVVPGGKGDTNSNEILRNDDGHISVDMLRARYPRTQRIESTAKEKDLVHRGSHQQFTFAELIQRSCSDSKSASNKTSRRRFYSTSEQSTMSATSKVPSGWGSQIYLAVTRSIKSSKTFEPLWQV